MICGGWDMIKTHEFKQIRTDNAEENKGDTVDMDIVGHKEGLGTYKINRKWRKALETYEIN